MRPGVLRAKAMVAAGGVAPRVPATRRMRSRCGPHRPAPYGFHFREYWLRAYGELLSFRAHLSTTR